MSSMAETSASVLSTEELRAAALAASNRRGKSVSWRRVLLRWSGWLVWRWLLPMIGLATVLVAIITVTCMQIFGANKVVNTTQDWMTEQWGIPKFVQNYKQSNTTDMLPRFDNGPTRGPQLQIDRGFSSKDLGLSPSPTSVSKPPGAQP